MRIFKRNVFIVLTITIITGLVFLFIYAPDIEIRRYLEREILMLGKQESGNPANENSGVQEPGAGGIQRTGSTTSDSCSDLQDGTSGWEVEGCFLSADEIDFFENISLSDKLKVFSIITRLKKEDIETIYRMTSNGITYKEMDNIRGILTARLGEKDVETLENLISKNKELYSVWKETQD